MLQQTRPRVCVKRYGWTDAARLSFEGAANAASTLGIARSQDASASLGRLQIAPAHPSETPPGCLGFRKAIAEPKLGSLTGDKYDVLLGPQMLDCVGLFSICVRQNGIAAANRGVARSVDRSTSFGAVMTNRHRRSLTVEMLWRLPESEASCQRRRDEI